MLLRREVTAEKFNLQIGGQKDEFFTKNKKSLYERWFQPKWRSYFCEGDQINVSSYISAQKITVGIQ